VNNVTFLVALQVRDIADPLNKKTVSSGTLFFCHLNGVPLWLLAKKIRLNE